MYSTNSTVFGTNPLPAVKVESPPTLNEKALRNRRPGKKAWLNKAVERGVGSHDGHENRHPRLRAAAGLRA